MARLCRSLANKVQNVFRIAKMDYIFSIHLAICKRYCITVFLHRLHRLLENIFICDSSNCICITHFCIYHLQITFEPKSRSNISFVNIRKLRYGLRRIATIRLVLRRHFIGSLGNLKIDSTERRVYQSFLIMLVVFLGTYLPAIVITVYMNTPFSNCSALNIMRDTVYLSVLFSALLRPLNLMIRLKLLRKEIMALVYSCCINEAN